MKKWTVFQDKSPQIVEADLMKISDTECLYFYLDYPENMTPCVIFKNWDSVWDMDLSLEPPK
jgi:hypothetical protein